MNLATKSSDGRTGVFIDNKQVSKAKILYLQTIRDLSRNYEEINSEMIIRELKRSRSAFETINRLERTGFIQSEDTPPHHPKKWKLTDKGQSVLNFIEQM